MRGLKDDLQDKEKRVRGKQNEAEVVSLDTHVSILSRG